MAERISDASKDVFWYLLCFAFVLLFSFLGILHKKCHKERENATEVFQKNSLIISSFRVTLFMMTLLG